MDVFNQYEIFKEKCFGFSSEFERKCFSDAKFICHPTVENEIISVCSDEEAKSNGLNICRFADMLLMSEDNENWKTFNLAEAREIALRQGYVYLTDLLFENAFYAEEWMISGKNDTIVVSEEYMREKGKKYAPVTPLTNRVLHFKKSKSEFFWEKSDEGEIISIDKDYISKSLDKYYNKCVSAVPSFAENDDLTFKLFDGEVAIDSNTTRALKTDVFFEQINNIINTLAEADEVFKSSEYDFSAKDYILKIAAGVLCSNGIEITPDEFKSKYVAPVVSLPADELEEKLSVISARCSDTEIDAVKLAFTDALKTADFEYNYPASEKSDYSKQMRDLEQKDFEDTVGIGEEKFLISSILSNRPEDYAIFAYTLRRYPEEADNLSKFVSFWNVSVIPESDLQHMIFNSYLSSELFDENGNFVSGIEQAGIIKDELEKVNVKYGFSDRSYIDELGDYIKDADLRSRSYNGTVFDTPEDMKRAMANELELQALCIDLSALDESELVDLRKHIEGITIDEATKAKYLVKVKIAMNRCEESMLDQLCLGLPMMDADETINLRNEVIKTNYSESVVRPKLADINNHLDTTLRKELDQKIAQIGAMDKDGITALVKSVKSGRYPSVMAESYLRKIDECVDNKIKAEIESICSGMESFNMEQLEEAKSKLLNSGYPEKYTYSVVNEINVLISDYEKNEVIGLFENIDFATEEELENIKAVIKEKNYSEELIEPYKDKIAMREQTLLDEELISLCENIEDMEQEALEELRNKIVSSEKNYNEELKEKSFDRIARREAELKNTELAERCKYIFSMDQAQLDELKEVLLGDKYDESITTVYLKKVTEREDELRCEELDKLCENIAEMDIEQLNALKDEISANEKYVAISDKYFADIDRCIDNIKNAEFNKLLDTVETMDESELEKFKSDIASKHENEEISDAMYEKSAAKAAERADAIEIEKLDKIVADIDSFNIEQAESAIDEINNASFKNEHKESYIISLNEKIEQLNKEALDALVAGSDSFSKEQLFEVKSKIEDYSCPAELKMPYIYNIENKIQEIAKKEIDGICGNISTLSTKKSLDAIVKIRALSIDEELKNQYLDSIEAHIMEIKNNEQRNYISYLKQKISEFNVSTVNFLVPTVSNLFYPKFDEASKHYVSAGRYELPIFLHDNSSDNGFTLTTEYFYFINKGVFNRIKIDDIVSFQAKKNFVNTSIVVSERNGNTNEIPCSINKNSIDATAKAMTALVNYIRDQRSAERMQELLENAVHERTQEIEIAAVKAAAENITATPLVAANAPAPEVQPSVEPDNVVEPDNAAEEPSEDNAEELTPPTPIPSETPKIRFCDQCGAKIASATAKFCAECGNKLF
ncbi:MAG: hypothetical protein MRZ61_09975 [Oscillospiraceae bacterium]|nr:hypothetical protein [Oscillospiraceae bacterium]